MNSMIKKLVAMMLVLAMLTGAACAEGTQTNPGNVPERGMIFPMTEADVTELHLSLTRMVGSLGGMSQLPMAYISVEDAEGKQQALAAFTEEDLNNPDKKMEIQLAQIPYDFMIYFIMMLDKASYDAKLAEGITMEQVMNVEKVDYLGENDGYVYLGSESYEFALGRAQTDAQKALVENAVARCKELVANLTFQPVVFAEGEFTVTPDSAMSFTTQDLNGNTVTEDLFLGKKLTVLNVWGTTCTPCINEMPELAHWSQNMPEGVQLVGLVSDLSSFDDEETRETAIYICEATGANVYTNLIANEEFMGLLQGLIGVPTTFFIDGNGAFVGEPVVGANVSGCMAFVEEYLAK